MRRGREAFEVLIANCKKKNGMIWTGVLPLLQFYYSIFFFFFIEREVLVWPASLLESGGRRLALGFPGLCEAGQVEPDK